MKRFIYGVIAMFVAAVMFTSCGNHETTTEDTVDCDSVEVVDSVSLNVDSLTDSATTE